MTNCGAWLISLMGVASIKGVVRCGRGLSWAWPHQSRPSPVRPVSVKFLQEDAGPRSASRAGIGPDEELEDFASLGAQEDHGLVAPRAGAHVHGHARQLVPAARQRTEGQLGPRPS